MTATVVVHHQLLSGADQVLIAVCTSVLTTGAWHLYNNGTTTPVAVTIYGDDRDR